MCSDCDLRDTYKTMLCVPCRKVWKYKFHLHNISCPRCGVRGFDMGWQWRPPKLNNKKAWKLIESGDYYWDTRAKARSKRVQAEERLKDIFFWRKLRQKKK